MVSMEPKVRRALTNTSHLPHEAYIERTFENVIKALFAITLQLYNDVLIAPGNLTTIDGAMETREDRVELSKLMYGIASGILVFIIITLTYVYCNRPGHGIIRFPTTLADTYSLLYASNAMEDVPRLRGNSADERASKLLNLGNTYTCRKFRGQDDSWHIGLYKEGPDTTGTASGSWAGKPSGKV